MNEFINNACNAVILLEKSMESASPDLLKLAIDYEKARGENVDVEDLYVDYWTFCEDTLDISIESIDCDISDTIDIPYKYVLDPSLIPILAEEKRLKREACDKLRKESLDKNTGFLERKRLSELKLKYEGTP